MSILSWLTRRKDAKHRDNSVDDDPYVEHRERLMEQILRELPHDPVYRREIERFEAEVAARRRAERS